MMQARTRTQLTDSGRARLAAAVRARMKRQWADPEWRAAQVAAYTRSVKCLHCHGRKGRSEMDGCCSVACRIARRDAREHDRALDRVEVDWRELAEAVTDAAGVHVEAGEVEHAVLCGVE